MTSKKNILIVQPTFNTNEARNIRTENILPFLSEDYNFHLIRLNIGKQNRSVTNITFHDVKVSSLTKKIHTSAFLISKKDKLLNFPYKVLHFLFRKLSYPDTWLHEHNRILESLKNKINHEFDTIIVSIKPFSNAILASKIKEIPYFKNCKVILDIGDPFAHNSVNKKINQKDVDFEKRVLNNSDKIIVTNIGTKNHYNTVYNQTHNKLAIIPQGVNLELFGNSPNYINNKSERLSLIYAGSFYPKLRDPENFFEAITKLTKVLPIEVNLYVGKINIPEQIKTNIIPYEKVSQNELTKKYQQNDILLFFDNAYGMQTSGKIYELLSLKKIIFFIYENEASPLKQETEKYSNIIFIKNHPDIIYNKILEYESIKHNIIIDDYDLNTFSWEGRAKLLRTVLNQTRD